MCSLRAWRQVKCGRLWAQFDWVGGVQSRDADSGLKATVSCLVGEASMLTRPYLSARGYCLVVRRVVE